MSGITKCDRLLLQSASGITKCDSYPVPDMDFFIRLSLILSQLELSRIELPKLGSYRSTKLIHFFKKHAACIGLQTKRISSVNI